MRGNFMLAKPAAKAAVTYGNYLARAPFELEVLLETAMLYQAPYRRADKPKYGYGKAYMLVM